MNIKYSKKIVAALIVLFALLAMCTPIQGIVVNSPPVANAGPDQTALVGDTVSFDGSGSYDLDGTIVSYDWNFDDGTTGTGVATTHVYLTAGTYTVTLTVTDDDAATGTDTAWVNVTVPNQAPTVDAGPDQTVNEGDTVSFSGSFSDPGDDVHTIMWDFGDGGNATGTLTPTHVYADNGVYTVTLAITDDEGATGTDTLNVTVNNVAPTIVDIDIKPESCPNPVNLDKEGLLPVAIIGTGDFDIKDIDPDTILLMREGYEFGVAPIRWNSEDTATPYTGTDDCGCHELGGDGCLDTSLKFDTQELVNELNLVEVVGLTIPLTLTGELRDGTLFEGQDCIWVLETKK